MKIDKRDLVIRRLTQSIHDMLAAMKNDPMWYSMPPEISRAVKDMNESKHVGIQQCNQAGLSILEAEVIS
jgi:hypothetical protein